MGSLGTPSLNDVERPATPHRSSRISRYVAPVSHLRITFNSIVPHNCRPLLSSVSFGQMHDRWDIRTCGSMWNVRPSGICSSSSSSCSSSLCTSLVNNIVWGEYVSFSFLIYILFYGFILRWHLFYHIASSSLFEFTTHSLFETWSWQILLTSQYLMWLSDCEF